jgi:serine/threonine protein kinase
MIQSLCAETDNDVTYSALHTFLGQVVIVKRLKTEQWQPDKVSHIRQYFHHKLALFTQTSHPQLVSPIDGFEEGGDCYVALLDTGGQCVSNWLDQHQRCTPEQAIALLSPIATILQSLHQVGIFHGHLSDQTLAIADDHSELVLSDISLVSFLPDEALANVTGDENNHLLPSKERQQRDIQALAAISYACLTGATDLLHQMAASFDPDAVLAQVQGQRADDDALTPAIVQGIANGLSLDGHTTLENWFQSFVQAASDGNPHELPSTWVDPSSMPLPPSVAPSSDSLGAGLTVVKSAQFTEGSGLQSVQPKQPSASLSKSALSNSNGHRPRSPHSSTRRFNRWRIPLVLGSSSIIAASFGGYLGLSLRLQEPEQLERSPIFGQEMFGSEQSFPESDDWPGKSSYAVDASRFLFEDRRPRSLYEGASEEAFVLPETETEVEPLQPDYEFSDELQLGTDVDGVLEPYTEPRIKDDDDVSTDTASDSAPASDSSGESGAPSPEDSDKLIIEPPPSEPEGWPSLLNDASVDRQEASPVSSSEILLYATSRYRTPSMS